MLVLRSDGAAVTDDRKRAYREQAAALKVPVYDEMTNAATALAAVANYESFLARKRESARR